MRRVLSPLAIVSVLIAGLEAETVHTLTITEAFDIAERQSPEILLARLDNLHADEDVEIARDPFSPKLLLRSDPLYTRGYPDNVYGHSPSLGAAQVDMSIYDRPRRYQLAATKEEVEGFKLGNESRILDAHYRIVSLFLDVLESEASARILSSQLQSLEEISAVVTQQVNAGRALPSESKRAQVRVKEVRSRIGSLVSDRTYAEMQIGAALGFSPGDRVQLDTRAGEFRLPEPDPQDQGTAQALATNPDLRRLQASLLGKRIELQSYQSTRLPQANLIAQYSFLQKSAFENYFASNRIQRNNLQIGADFILPVLVGSAPSGHISQALTDYTKLDRQVFQTRNRVIAEIRRGYELLEIAKGSLSVSREQFALANEQLKVTRALGDEGRAALSELEQAHIASGDRETAVAIGSLEIERAKLLILRETGSLIPAVRTALQKH